MSQAEPSHLETLQAEIAHLQGELQLRDQLVDQLSQELFRLVKDPESANSSLGEADQNESQIERLNVQIREIEEQLQFYRQQIGTRDQEIYQLQSKIKTLMAKNQNLEKMLEDLPELYRQKFAQRMKPVKEKVEQLQRENRQLQAQVQTLTYRLTIRNRPSHEQDIDLPNFHKTDQHF
ncbi:MAG: hypothetical protein RI580_11905 [Halothece sp. Uz-M2-17]|mgnify:CR=1 FL=1|nr:hypothetical protein [Halothece sp. Uz-M2-17]